MKFLCTLLVVCAISADLIAATYYEDSDSDSDDYSTYRVSLSLFFYFLFYMFDKHLIIW